MTTPSHISSIEALLAPRSVAVVGASPTSFVGRVLCDNLVKLGYPGKILPVNPRYAEVAGLTCYPSVEDLPVVPDAVVAAVRVSLIPDVVRTAARRGSRAAVVPGAGFSETGEAALDVQAQIAGMGAEFGMAVAGPNCMGIVSPTHRSAMYIGTIPEMLLGGRVALVSQSGSVCEAAVNIGPRIGFSSIVSCGTEAATTIGHYLSYFAADSETGAVLVFVEGFRDPTGFVDGARALREIGKPLAVLQAGRSKEAAAAIAAHSGTLAGTDEVVTGLLHQLGAIGVDDLDELFEVGELLGHGRMPNGRRAFVVTDSGGEANLIADHARSVGLELPTPSTEMTRTLRERWPNFSYIGNPIDPWGVDDDFEALYAEILRAAAEEDVDVVAMALDKVTPWAGENERELGLATAKALVEATAESGKLSLYFTVHATGVADAPIRDLLRAAGVPLLHGMRPALVALTRAAYWQTWPRRTYPAAEQPAVGLSFSETGPILSERASREVLGAYAIPLVPAAAAATEPEAADVAQRLGFPVVMKGDISGVAHKAAAGLVVTGISSADRAREAFRELVGRQGTAGRGVVVEATATGVELICGARRDPVFGPVVLLGAGGAFAEVLRDVAVRLCPPSQEDLVEMLDECAAGRLLTAGGADPIAVLQVVEALSRLMLEHPQVAEVDVNPLFANREGAAAADALVVLGS